MINSIKMQVDLIRLHDELDALKDQLADVVKALEHEYTKGYADGKAAEGYSQEEFDASYQDGYEDGLIQGRGESAYEGTETYTAGYEDGANDMAIAYTTKYQIGWQNGEEVGFKKGFEAAIASFKGV